MCSFRCFPSLSSCRGPTVLYNSNVNTKRRLTEKQVYTNPITHDTKQNYQSTVRIFPERHIGVCIRHFLVFVSGQKQLTEGSAACCSAVDGRRLDYRTGLHSHAVPSDGRDWAVLFLKYNLWLLVFNRGFPPTVVLSAPLDLWPFMKGRSTCAAAFGKQTLTCRFWANGKSFFFLCEDTCSSTSRLQWLDVSYLENFGKKTKDI